MYNFFTIIYILGVYWPDTITNANLWDCTKQEPVEIQIRRRNWSLIGHTLRRDNKSITEQALSWNPQGKRSRGRPKSTWRRSTEQEMKVVGLSWQQLDQRVQEQRGWMVLIDGLCSLVNQKAKVSNFFTIDAQSSHLSLGLLKFPRVSELEF